MTIFEAEIRKKHLYPFLYGISMVVDECKLKINRDGIYVNEVDPANVCRVDSKLPIECFESTSYKSTQEPIVIGLDLSKYIQIFTDDNITDESLVRLTLLDPVGGYAPKLRTTIYNDGVEVVRYDHTTLRIENIRKSPKIRDILEYLTVETIIPLKFLKRGVKAIEHVGGDHVHIGVNFDTPGNTPMMFIKSFDTANVACTQIKTTRLPEFRYSGSGRDEIKSLYSMDYIKDIYKAFSEYGPDKNIRLNLGTDWPVLCSTVFDNTGPELRIMLAPKIG